MKFYYRLFLLSVISSLSIGLTSCGDDDEDEGTPNNESSLLISSTGTYNGYEYVDLGLSVMWASYNLGGESATDYGDYFAWGETEAKTTYDSSTSTTYKVEMSDISGDEQYDAATALWGGSWRLPTQEEIEELMEECTWSWLMIDSIFGYYITADNGNSIFLPAGGGMSDESIHYRRSRGYYWSSTPDADDKGNAMFLRFYNTEQYIRSDYRYTGRSIRAVY